MKLASNFKYHISLKVLYCVLIYLILEYVIIIYDLVQIERAKRMFFKFVKYILGIVHSPHNYVPVVGKLGLKFLAEHKRVINLKLYINKRN